MIILRDKTEITKNGATLKAFGQPVERRERLNSTIRHTFMALRMTNKAAHDKINSNLKIPTDKFAYRLQAE